MGVLSVRSSLLDSEEIEVIFASCIKGELMCSTLARSLRLSALMGLVTAVSLSMNSFD